MIIALVMKLNIHYKLEEKLIQNQSPIFKSNILRTIKGDTSFLKFKIAPLQGQTE